MAIVPDQAPIASFLARSKFPPGVVGTLDASGSSDPDGSVAVFDWSFGDGNAVPNAGLTLAHKFAKPGRYSVTLTVVDNEGCSTSQIFTGHTASCNGSSSATQTLSVKVAYPGVRVRCPKKAKAKACKVTLQALAKKKRKGKKKPKTIAQSAVAAARVKRGKSRIVSLKPKKRYAKKLARAKKVLVKETRTIGKAKRVRYVKLKIVQ